MHLISEAKKTDAKEERAEKEELGVRGQLIWVVGGVRWPN